MSNGYGASFWGTLQGSRPAVRDDLLKEKRENFREVRSDWEKNSRRYAWYRWRITARIERRRRGKENREEKTCRRKMLVLVLG